MSKISSLVISPHVDDEVLGCGGILDEECFVYYCGINESKWTEGTTLNDAVHRISVDARLKELEAVASFLGFKYECNFTSHVNLFSEQEFLPIFEALINRLRPERVFLPYVAGYNQDHRAIFNAAFIALRPHDQNFFVRKVLVYEAVHDVLWSHENMVINYFIPIDVERKVRAYGLHQSQIRAFRSPDMLRRVAKLRGDMSNCEHAEAFQILRWVEDAPLSRRETSQLTEDLDTRRGTNKKFGDKDLDQWLVDKLNPERGESMLDLGCGTGTQLIKLVQHSESDDCMGIDISADSIKEAVRRSGESGVRVKLMVGSMDNLDHSQVKDGSFDTVYSIYSIYYAKDVKNVLATLKRKIKPTGRIAIMTPYRDNNQSWFELLGQFMKLPDNVTRSSSTFMEEEIIPFANENFAVVNTFEFVNKVSIPSYEDLYNYWASNIYYKEELDQAFEEHARAHFARHEAFELFKKGLLVVMQRPNVISTPEPR